MAIDRYATPDNYIAEHTGGEGFDVIYDTLGGDALDASFVAAKRYSGHVVSCLGWGAHSLAPLSFRAATYSGVFTLMPLLTGQGRAHHGHILREVAELAESGQLKAYLTEQTFNAVEIASAYDTVAKGSRGKVVIDL